MVPVLVCIELVKYGTELYIILNHLSVLPVLVRRRRSTGACTVECRHSLCWNTYWTGVATRKHVTFQFTSWVVSSTMAETTNAPNGKCIYAMFQKKSWPLSHFSITGKSWPIFIFFTVRFRKDVQKKIELNTFPQICCRTTCEQEAQLMLTTGSTRLAVSRGQQIWDHSTCNI